MSLNTRLLAEFDEWAEKREIDLTKEELLKKLKSIKLICLLDNESDNFVPLKKILEKDWRTNHRVDFWACGTQAQEDEFDQKLENMFSGGG